MTQKGYITRRRFFKGAAAAVGAPLVIHGSSLGLLGAAPSQRITMGVIGLGGRGRNVFRNLVSRDGVQGNHVCAVVVGNPGRGINGATLYDHATGHRPR